MLAAGGGDVETRVVVLRRNRKVEVHSADGVYRTAEADEVELHNVGDGDAEVGLDGLDQLVGTGVVRGVDPVVLPYLAGVAGHRHHSVTRDGEHAHLSCGGDHVDDLDHVAALAAGGRRTAIGVLISIGHAHTAVRADEQHVERGADRCDLEVLDRDLRDLVEAVLHVDVSRADSHDGEGHQDHAGKQDPVEPGPLRLRSANSGRRSRSTRRRLTSFLTRQPRPEVT